MSTKKNPSKTPSITKDMLVHVSRLSKTEKVAAFSTGTIYQIADVSTIVQGCVKQVVEHRLLLADKLLEVAKRLDKEGRGAQPDEFLLRSAVNRAYYSMHNSLRAISLHSLGHDPDDHASAIGTLAELLKDNAFRSRSHLLVGTDKKASQAMDNRLVADYSPYEISRYPNGAVRITITNGNWADASKFNIDLANEILIGSLSLVT